MVRKFYLSHSSLADGRSEADGNESAAVVLCALGMFQLTSDARWIRSPSLTGDRIYTRNRERNE